MKKNVLVTAVGGRSVGSGILHALTRSSKTVANRWNVFAADADPFAWGLYVAKNSLLLPLGNSSNYIHCINRAIRKHNIAAVLPGSEIETSVLSEHQNEILAPVICNRPQLMPLMMDKIEMAKILKALGVSVIESVPLLEWKKLIKTFSFPCIIKPFVGTGGSRGLRIVFSKAEIEQIVLEIPNPETYCIQPYIGNGNEEYTVGVLSNKNGRVIDSIVMQRKLAGLSLLECKKNSGKEYPISTGYSQGFFIREPKIQSFCENLAQLLDSRGPLNIQLRVDNGKIFVFEIHPRFSGTSPMRADVGFNEPDILLRHHLLGESFNKRIKYSNNVAAIRAFEHVIIPISKMKKKLHD